MIYLNNVEVTLENDFFPTPNPAHHHIQNQMKLDFIRLALIFLEKIVFNVWISVSNRAPSAAGTKAKWTYASGADAFSGLIYSTSSAKNVGDLSYNNVVLTRIVLWESKVYFIEPDVYN